MRKTLLSLGVLSFGLVVVSLLCLGLATPVQAITQTNVTLWFSGSIQYRITSDTTWSDFAKPSQLMDPADYTFRFSDDSHPYVEINISVSGASMEKTIAYLRLTDHSGNGLAGGTARGGYTTPTSWFVSGATNSDGALLDIRIGKPASLAYEMRFNNTTSVKGPQDPSINSFFDFQTILLTLRLETCGGTPLDGGNPRYGIGSTYTSSWFPGGLTGTSASGETVAEFFPGTYSFEMQYKATADAKLNVVIPNANTNIKWQTTNVTLYYSGQISYGGSGDSTWFTKPSMELLQGTYWFHFRNGARTTLTISGCNMKKNVVALILKDSNGNPLSGGKARGGFGSSYWTWWVPGLTDANGALLDIRDVASQPTNMSYEMRYNNTTKALTQNVSVNSIFQYKTILLTLRLETCGGATPLDGGKPRYGIGSTYTTWWFPGGVTGTSASGESKAEVFPGTYSFEMQYKATADAKLNVVIPNANTKITWQTTNMTLWFSGQIAYGGATGDSTWFTKPSMELLPGTYKFRFSGSGHPNTRTDITISGCTTEKTIAYLRVTQSNGSTGVPGVTFVWQIHGVPPDQAVPGVTDANGALLHVMNGKNNSPTRYLPTYLGGVGPRRDPLPATQSFVDWRLINVTVELRDHNNTLIGTPLVTFEYPGGGRQQFGSLVGGTLSKEMMPTSGYVAFFIDNYNDSKQRKDASPMSIGPYVLTFQTGLAQNSGWNPTYFRYSGGANHNWTGDIELLPRNDFYFFHNEADRIGPRTIVAGKVNLINTDGTVTVAP